MITKGTTFFELLKNRLLNAFYKKGKQYVIIHHTAGGNSIWDVNDEHRQRWNSLSSLNMYVGYNRVIDPSAKTWICRADTEVPIHCYGWNHLAYGLSVIGNYETDSVAPDVKKELIRQMDYYRTTYNIPRKNFLCHKDVKATLCPGKEIEKIVRDYQKGLI